MAKQPARIGGRGRSNEPAAPVRVGAEIKELARQYGPDALQRVARLAGLVRDADGNVVGGAESETVAMRALEILMDRAYGKAVQGIEHSGADGGPILGVIMVPTKDGK